MANSNRRTRAGRRSAWPRPIGLCGAAVVLLGAAGCSGSGGNSAGPGPEPAHPALLVRASDYAALRARAAIEPWRSVALEAQRYALQETFDPFVTDFQAKTRMTDLCGALALAWILDPDPALVAKLASTLALWPDYFKATPGSGGGTQVRWQQAAMTHSILALDVMGAALTPEDRQAIEDEIGGMVTQWWQNLPQDGTTSTPGVTLIWALYAGDRALFDQAHALYRARLFGELTPAGIFEGGSGYAWVRHGGDRLGKVLPMDVLEFTGEDTTLYSDPRIRTLHEWMFASAYTPMRTNLTFGDSDPSRPIEALLGYWQPFRAHLVSPSAGRNAAWLTRDVTPRPGLVEFVLMTDGSSAQAPGSTIWSDCATLREAGSEPDSLMGALWSPRSSGSHSHKDVNAVHLCGYGENLLVNAGYCGAGEGLDATFDWDWIFDTAASSNTVSVDGVDHRSKVGGGVVEGLMATRFDYAAASSGTALPNGDHERALLMLHGEPGLPGYFVLLDETRVDAPGPATEVWLDLHPASAVVTTITPGLEYEWSIQRFGSRPVAFSVFLASVPAVVELRDGGLCAFDDQGFVGRSLRARYPATGANPVRSVTVLFPHDATHLRPTLTAIGVPGEFSGARLESSTGITDVVLESAGQFPAVVGPEIFQGSATHFRSGPGGMQQYFLRSGRTFDDGAVARTGLDSAMDVSAFVRGREAWVTSSGGEVVFWEPTLTGGSFAAPGVTVLEAGPGFVRVALSPGRQAFDLDTGATLP